MAESKMLAAQFWGFEENVREAKFGWFGFVQRRNPEYIGRRILKMELQDSEEDQIGDSWNFNISHILHSLHYSSERE